MTGKITFESLPQAVEEILQKVEGLEKAISTIVSRPGAKEENWLNIDQLCEYLPDHPAKQTVYGWITSSYVPYYKKGKKLAFLQSEIDEWMASGRHKTDVEIREAAISYVESKKFGL